MRQTAAPVPVNCDIGERGAGHPVDIELMRWIDIANLACGGHAGDERSVRAFRQMARDHRVTVTAHLSYPDREHFGRRSVEIDTPRLLESLARQYALLPDIRVVKFHGALYNDSCARSELAGTLTDWLTRTECDTVITAPDSALARACSASGIGVLREAFAERRYRVDPESGRLSLVGRDRSYACIAEISEAVAQAVAIVDRGEVSAVVESDSGTVAIRTAFLAADTICIHSDSAIALPLARELRRRLSGPDKR